MLKIMNLMCGESHLYYSHSVIVCNCLGTCGHMKCCVDFSNENDTNLVNSRA